LRLQGSDVLRHGLFREPDAIATVGFRLIKRRVDFVNKFLRPSGDRKPWSRALLIAIAWRICSARERSRANAGRCGTLSSQRGRAEIASCLHDRSNAERLFVRFHLTCRYMTCFSFFWRIFLQQRTARGSLREFRRRFDLMRHTSDGQRFALRHIGTCYWL
jgi:hypothetical protein